ncbi:hypothetical protein [Lichenibacterium dinghuense]|nr:hypothetical protein [Lichenibacterium sp. 6Y81]
MTAGSGRDGARDAARPLTGAEARGPIERLRLDVLSSMARRTMH